MKTIALLFQCLCAAFAIFVVAGCGGSSGQTASAAARGTASVTITWPAPTRLIPVDSQSITISFRSGTTVVGSQTVAKPASGGTQTVTFSGLPVGDLSLTAQAFPTTDGSGIAQASATQPITISEGQDTPASLIMASTIAGFHISPSITTVGVGSTLTIVPTAFNSQNATVLTSPSTISWSSSDTSVATITDSGVLTGVALGPATITVTDSESGATGSFPVTVVTSTGGVNVNVH